MGKQETRISKAGGIGGWNPGNSATVAGTSMTSDYDDQY